MSSYKIISCSQQPEFYARAFNLILPKEKFNCSLVSKILNKDDSIYVIIHTQPDKTLTLKAVFSYTTGGNFSFYAPQFSKEITKEIVGFLKHKTLFCVSGEKSCVEYILQTAKDYLKQEPRDNRDMFLMEQDFTVPISPVQTKIPVQAKKCTSTDEELLMPLQINYSAEEVLPFYKRPYPPAERAILHNAIQTDTLFGAFISPQKKDLFVAKAQTNARTLNYYQIGGVYTLPQYRSQGMAKLVVSLVCSLIKEQGKKAILFVRKNNPPAQKAYSSIGFKIFGEYMMCYF